MINKFNDKEYWKNRHSDKDNIRVVGVKGVTIKGNYYIYKFLNEQYKKILARIDISEMETLFDCGFGDGYFLDFFHNNYPHLKLSGIDISPDAKKRIDFIDQKNLYTGDLTEMKINKTYDIVQSFDVLYHILDDANHYAALKNIAKISKKYIILHERFSTKAELLSSKHVRMRRSEYTNQILNSEGFYLYKEIPTHFIAMRLLTYRLNSYLPQILYKMDQRISERFHEATQERLASHFIRVYKRS